LQPHFTRFTVLHGSRSLYDTLAIASLGKM